MTMQFSMASAHQNRHPFLKLDIYFFAIALEAILIGFVVLILMSKFLPTSSTENTINLVFNEVSQEKLQEPEKPKMIPKPIKEQIKTPVKPNTPKVTPDIPRSEMPSENQAYPTPHNPSHISESTTSTTSQASSNTTNKPDPMSLYRGQVNAAIQAATVCTSVAKDMNLVGKTRIQFNLKDSQQSGASIISSSGIPMLDRSAMTAVQIAKYPKPPEEFAGENKVMTVLVNLNCSN